MCASKYVDDYDDDGLDEDYGGDFEGMSPEDEAAMTEATAQVRKSLGKNANRISLGNIQDILWHYYYDVDKTVTYLNANYIAPLEKSTQKPVAPKKTSEGTYRTFSFFATHSQSVGAYKADHQCSSKDGGRPCSAGRPVFPVVAKSDLSYRSFFDDMPWLGTPQDRQAVFIEPWRPRGGLLGGGTQGTAGMSKLQKLAAARKKKNDEKKENDKTGQVQEGFSKLAISEASAKEDRRPVASLAKRQKLSSGFRASAQQAHDTPECEVEDLGNQGGKESTVVPSRHPGDESDQAAEMAPVRASPSAFARTLFGSAPEPKTTGWDVLPMPYTSSSSFSAKIFSEPSPDDIVLAAQSKGSNYGRAK